MRTFELRVYKLVTKEALDFYREKIYPRHLNSFPLFGIEAHGFWTAKEDVEPRLFVLASYAAGEDPGEVARGYLRSTEFADHIAANRRYRYDTGTSPASPTPVKAPVVVAVSST